MIVAPLVRSERRGHSYRGVTVELAQPRREGLDQREQIALVDVPRLVHAVDAIGDHDPGRAEARSRIGYEHAEDPSFGELAREMAAIVPERQSEVVVREPNGADAVPGCELEQDREDHRVEVHVQVAVDVREL